MNKPIIHQSITRDPANFEKCASCACQLPPHQARLYQVRIPDGGGQHLHSFWCLGCVETKLVSREVAA